VKKPFTIAKVVGSAAVATLIACGGPADAPTSSSDEALGSRAAPQAAAHVPACVGPAALGDARCHARVIVDDTGKPLATTGPTGLGPADLQAAYALPSATAGAGQVFGIVDAFDDPNAESDLATYRGQFGLPPCTTANGCFRKVNQSGVQGNYPRTNQGWALEISLDLAMASAVCPNCRILLVEAKTNSFANLGAAVNTAVRLGATVVSNSYGGAEFASEATDTFFNHPGVAVTASSGDSGFGVEYPAASGFVTAVGGTSLRRAANARGWTETAWSGAGSGCSAFIAKPAWQADAGCAMRSVADVSAVADPNTGVSVFDSFGLQGQKGWFVVGGTSASAPLVAGVYALAGNAALVDYGSFPYAHAASLFDVTSGSNGACSPAYLCTAGAGYDGPTGLGTPDATGAF
jgi:subtilase family serine protease